MGKKKAWSYHNAENCMYGTMICTACHKKVESGQFRMRETNDAYLVQHRHCSQDDKQWAKMDKESAKYVQNIKEKLAEYIAFRDKWGAWELDEEIESMQVLVNSNAD